MEATMMRYCSNSISNNGLVLKALKPLQFKLTNPPQCSISSHSLHSGGYMMDCYWMLGVPFCSWQSQSKRLMPQLVPNMV
uniref:Uncharacterized protein n=1 Tax=Cannabis sativa TaxID=3483 RepID=A0A803R5S2_CANSA